MKSSMILYILKREPGFLMFLAKHLKLYTYVGLLTVYYLYSVYECLFISEIAILIQDRELHNIKDPVHQYHIPEAKDLEKLVHIRLHNMGQVPQHHIPPVIHHV